MAIFSSDLKDVIKRLANKEFSGNDERDELLKKLGAFPNIRSRDVMWMLFRHDRVVRDSGIKLLQKLKDPETVDAFLQRVIHHGYLPRGFGVYPLPSGPMGR